MNNSLTQRIPPVTLNLIIVNVLIWLAMQILPNSFDLTMSRTCGLHYFTSPDFKPWQLITYMFLHSTQGLSHLFFNMFALFMFGGLIERVFGSARFLFFYITVGIGAGLVQEAVYAIMLAHYTSGISSVDLHTIIYDGMAPMVQGVDMSAWIEHCREIWSLVNTPTVGASGAIYGILLAFGMIFPNMPLYIFMVMPVKAKWAVLGYGILELTLGVTGMQSGVAHFAHLGGMIVALILIIYWRKKGAMHHGPLY